MLQNNPELKSKINQLWDKFWSGGIANPLTAIEQITYLLFMKRLDELAAAACLSPFHFARAFQRTTGKTPYAYLLERRIARAKDRLSHSSLSLVEIAQETGFATQSGFTRAFTKATGIPPGRFRIERR